MLGQKSKQNPEQNELISVRYQAQKRGIKL